MQSDPNGRRQSNELSELLNLRMPAESGSIAVISDALSECLVLLKVPEEKQLEIGLAVHEALSNAIVHGCKKDASKEIQCRLQCDPQGRIAIIVTDPGPGFSPEVLPDPRQGENVYADHGRGIYLIRQLMNEVHFENGGNEIRMWKY